MAVLASEEKGDRIGRAGAAARRAPVGKVTHATRGRALLEASLGFLALLLIVIAALGLRALWSLGHIVL